MEIIRTKKLSLRMDLTPLIDVIFQLLVFFMLTSTFSNPVIKLDLPKAVTSNNVSQDVIVVSINKEGELFVNNQESTFEKLKDDLKGLLLMQEKKSVNIKGDRDMPYKYFVQIMDLSKQAGAQHVNIVHQREDAQ